MTESQRPMAGNSELSPAQLIEAARGVLSVVRNGVGPIAVVVNNNQRGNEHIIETAPNVTLDVGTKLYAAPAPERGTLDRERLLAVLEGLECEEIDVLMTQTPFVLRAVAKHIALAAQLGAHLMPPADEAADEAALLPGLRCARLTILNAEDIPIQPYAIQIIDRIIAQCEGNEP